MRSYHFSFMVSKIKIGQTWVLFNWMNTMNILVDDPNHPLFKALDYGNKMIRRFLINGSSSDFDYLVAHSFLVNDQEVVRDFVRNQFLLATKPENLSVTMMPSSEGCDFRCVYCYEDHGNNKLMGEQDLEVFTRFVIRQKLSTLRVDYFGGEPLVNLPFVKACNARMLELGDKHGFVVTPSSMTTNGYLLTKETFLTLHDLRITSYQVTIDGDRETHDRLRPHMSSKGTYDIVYQNLLALANTDKKFSLTLRMNFTPTTGAAAGRKEFLDKITRDFGGDKRFILMPEPIGKWTNGEKHNRDIHCNKLQGSEFRDAFQAEAEVMGLETLGMVLLCGPESHFCYAGKPNNLIIYPQDQNGNMPIQKCTLEVRRGDNNVGHITPEGELVKNENWPKWIANDVFASAKCKNCFFVLNCFGNACVHKNQMKGRTICPKEKQQESVLVSRVLQYITRNLD